jgi:hypothetical protein
MDTGTELNLIRFLFLRLRAVNVLMGTETHRLSSTAVSPGTATGPIFNYANCGFGALE